MLLRVIRRLVAPIAGALLLGLGSVLHASDEQPIVVVSGLTPDLSHTRPADRRPREWSEARTLSTGWEFVRGDLGGVWEALRSNDRALDLPVWQPVTLPHSFNGRDSVDPDIPYYQGPGWYRTQLDLHNPYANGRVLLLFEGAAQKADVWIGDQIVATHIGGYNEFTVDITDAVAAYRTSALARLPATEYRVTPGWIPLTVRCDNSRDVERIPSSLSDFSIYGGLDRPVHLIYLPAHGLLGVDAQPRRDEDGSWHVAVSGHFLEPGGGANATAQHVTVSVIDPDGAPVASAERDLAAAGTSAATIADLAIPGPRLWSPSNPALYGVEVTASGSDGTSRSWQRFGLRTFEFVEHGPFKLNGERLLLHGTHRHEDFAGLASGVPEELVEKEMRLMKAMGANFIRLAHYQQSRRVLELCDELGLLVWEEIPWCRGGLGGDAYKNQARSMLRDMIEQHRNHPAVILWGLGNENDWPGDFEDFDKAKIRDFMRELNTLAHALDPTRLTVIRRCEFCADIPDVYSPSIWAGWYRGQYTEYAAIVRKQMLKVPRFFHAEWGGDSHAGRHAEDPYATLTALKSTGAADERGLDFTNSGGDVRASRDGDWSETYICDLVDWTLKEQEKMPWLTGSAMWPFKDFSTPLRPEDPVPFVNEKGAVQRDLTPKESYYVYQSYWTDTPMLHVYGHSWPVRWGQPGEKRWIKVYSNCPEVELWVNGVSHGVRRRDSQDFPAAGLRWEVPFEDGMNTVRAVGHRDGHTATDEVSFRYESRPWGKKDHLRLQQFPAGAGRVRVQAELLDADGVVCLDARDYIRFGQTGDGRLVDDLGTPGGSRYVQLSNGRAQIDIDLRAGDQSVASAHVEGVPTAFLTLHAPVRNDMTDASAVESRWRHLLSAERARVLAQADAVRNHRPVSIRQAKVPAFAANAGVQAGDYFSMGDYWWPNPKTADGLPYVRRDGESNPRNFDAHRLALREMRDAVAALAAAYVVSGDATYATRASEWLRVFFVDPATRMNPNLNFAQAIPGVSPGRGIGIIDTLHLCEVALAAEAIAKAPSVDHVTLEAVRAWFADYLQWLLTSRHGHDEATAKNNHSVAYWLQVAVFARYAGNPAAVDQARRVFTGTLLPTQLAPDGSFPRELARTKPLGYSIFQLDNVALLADVLSTPQQDLWHYRLNDGRNVGQAIAFLFPYLEAPARWPFAPDVSHFEAWPVRQAALLLGGLRLHRPEYLELWRRLDPNPSDLEVRRNLAMTQPVLWLKAAGD
jgi:beta-galactosidase